MAIRLLRGVLHGLKWALCVVGAVALIVAAMIATLRPAEIARSASRAIHWQIPFSRARFLILPWLSIALATAATYSRLTRLGETRTAVLRSSSGSEGQTAGVHGLEERWARPVYSANPCFTIGRSS